VLLKAGHRVARKGWNGKGMWLLMTGGDTLIMEQGDGTEIEYPGLPYILMKTADDKAVPWLASQTDILAEDWTLVEEFVE
jgi:hypothetical protein